MVIDIELFTEPNIDSDEWYATQCGYCSNEEVGNGEDTYVVINSSDLVCNNQRCKGDMLEDYMESEKFHNIEEGRKLSLTNMWYVTASGGQRDVCCEDDGNECGCSPIA